MMVFASLSWAAGSFFSKSLPLPKDPFVSTAVQMVLGGGAAMLAGLVAGEPFETDFSSFSTSSLLALTYLVVIGSWVAFTAYTWLLQNAPISKVATYAYVNPVIAVFLGWLVANETITSLVLVAAAIIVASVAFIVRNETPAAKKEDPAEAAPVPAMASVDS